MHYNSEVLFFGDAFVNTVAQVRFAESVDCTTTVSDIDFHTR